jgi:hypothetical protein
MAKKKQSSSTVASPAGVSPVVTALASAAAVGAGILIGRTLLAPATPPAGQLTTSKVIDPGTSKVIDPRTSEIVLRAPAPAPRMMLAGPASLFATDPAPQYSTLPAVQGRSFTAEGVSLAARLFAEAGLDCRAWRLATPAQRRAFAAQAVATRAYQVLRLLYAGSAAPEPTRLRPGITHTSELRSLEARYAQQVPSWVRLLGLPDAVDAATLLAAVLDLFCAQYPEFAPTSQQLSASTVVPTPQQIGSPFVTPLSQQLDERVVLPTPQRLGSSFVESTQQRLDTSLVRPVPTAPARVAVAGPSARDESIATALLALMPGVRGDCDRWASLDPAERARLASEARARAAVAGTTYDNAGALALLDQYCAWRRAQAALAETASPKRGASRPAVKIAPAVLSAFFPGHGQ